MTTTSIYHVYINRDYKCTIIPVYCGSNVEQPIAFNLQDFLPLEKYISDKLHNHINQFIKDNVSDTDIYKEILKQYKEVKELNNRIQEREKKEKEIRERKLKGFTEEYNNICKKYNIVACVEVVDSYYIADLFLDKNDSKLNDREEFINN